MTDDGVLIEAAAVHVPAVSPGLLIASDTTPACGPDEAHGLLGRKGLLFKEPAVRMAMCAVHSALGLPPGRPAEAVPGAAGTAVVVSSNLGNVATVCDIVDQVRVGGLRGVSPMQAPNASSNIIASSIAIRYGFTGPNLMVCSGATGGLDAVRLGALLVRAGRTHRAVVVGAEPADEVATALRVAAGLRPGPPAGLAACVVLTAGQRPGGIRLRSVRRHGSPEAAPADEHSPLRIFCDDVADPDLAAVLGSGYGATGVLQTALGARWLADPSARPSGVDGATEAIVTCGSADDGYATARLSRTGGRA
ncbi:beta-ketoacyl synthase N-terminal-like domain-containing protein [Micromonospora sp. C28ISP2-4]|uniref:beta-ketoacyl synthase N-terminal-like domain-containing protein n=1 Tax=Micromonospora sp. C28ISP2-4 TaxID=3059523 RepID=UPI0026773918|nr:beta-ketoacyl synthase N-terminal-like domain-containing protein [Micromonospora sp. C28ISP2-4]MDO3686669.1 beta-ketoacyl synthase N-terminal-like domain-containing protein [Micromonospora sp. C28ISP2-4]